MFKTFNFSIIKNKNIYNIKSKLYFVIINHVLVDFNNNNLKYFILVEYVMLQNFYKTNLIA